MNTGNILIYKTNKNIYRKGGKLGRKKLGGGKVCGGKLSIAESLW